MVPKKRIYLVYYHILPEKVLSDEECTKAADVYSFGIIAYEIVTGFPPYPDTPHHRDLAMKICNDQLLNYSNLPKPKNEENFERELEELTKSISDLCSGDSGIIDLDMSNF
ncbi:hypothetical protein Glove_490g56 [Diversispora epigaea]|uniref:Protein kinase domain-containing protein n=1 Tax=Diversispora epigaea TaxID=1348612 RepID=A0A397GIS5_9GLOM|nr:hypothetical protein Glove_490g56 [Diversispora epigaea]